MKTTEAKLAEILYQKFATERKRLNKLITIIENAGGGNLLNGDFKQTLFLAKGSTVGKKYRNALDAEIENE